MVQDGDGQLDPNEILGARSSEGPIQKAASLWQVAELAENPLVQRVISVFDKARLHITRH